jgi:hypothetical protein
VGDAETVGDVAADGDGGANSPRDPEANVDREACTRRDAEAVGRSGTDSAAVLAAAGVAEMSLIITAMTTSASTVMPVSTHIIPRCRRRRRSAGLLLSSPMTSG